MDVGTGVGQTHRHKLLEDPSVKSYTGEESKHGVYGSRTVRRGHAGGFDFGPSAESVAFSLDLRLISLLNLFEGLRLTRSASVVILFKRGCFATASNFFCKTNPTAADVESDILQRKKPHPSLANVWPKGLRPASRSKCKI